MKSTVGMTTSVDADVYLKIRELAEKEERSLSNVVNRAMVMYLHAADKEELARLNRLEVENAEVAKV